MKKIVLLIAFLQLFNAYAQEKYKVVYDFQSGNLNYFKLDKNNKIADTLAKPKFKKNSLVVIEVKNVNPFAIKLEADVKEEAIHEAGQGFNLGGLLGGISSFAGQDLKINSQEIQNNSSVYGEMFKSRGPGIQKKFSEIDELNANIAALKTTLIANLSNPKLSKEDIKKNLMELSKLQEDFRLGDPEKNYYKFLTDLELIVKSENTKLQSEIETLSSTIDENLEQNLLSRGAFNQNQVSLKNLSQVANNLNASVAQSTTNLLDLKSMFSQLEAANFNQTFDYIIQTDKANVELKFSSVEATDEKAAIIRQIPLASKGGFKINTSVALTLNSFGDKSNNYFIDQDGIIGADAENSFVPNMATIINFYPLLSDNFNIGGSFGVSIPLSDAIRGVNFLIGPSLIFGNKNRVSLTGGLAYGPVNRLTNGLQVGQETNFTSLNNFTKNVYEVGYFFGISFSLFDIK